jgi:hypothetical protein
MISIVSGGDKHAPKGAQLDFLLTQARAAANTLARQYADRTRALEPLAVERMISVVSGGERAPRGERLRSLIEYATAASATLVRLTGDERRKLVEASDASSSTAAH